MNKRILSFLLALTLLISVGVIAYADGAVFTIVLPDKMPRAGEEFTVEVDLSGNPGFNALGLTLEYDASAMTCYKINAGELVTNMLYVTNPSTSAGAVISGVVIESVTADGSVATFRFKADRDIDSLDFELRDVTFADSKSKAIAYSVKTSGGAPQTDPAPYTPPVSEPVTSDPEPVQTEPAQVPSFPDVENHWSKQFVEKAAALKLFNGYPNGSFGPDDLVTRGQFVTVLYRYCGSPAVSEAAPFADISDESEEFRSAIAWAYSKGIVNGVSETKFAPKAFVQRQEAVKILYSLAGGAPGVEMMFYKIYDDSFTDSGSIAPWAKVPVYWAVYNGLISGASENTLAPSAYASRAQLAKILTVYIEKFGGTNA